MERGRVAAVVAVLVVVSAACSSASGTAADVNAGDGSGDSDVTTATEPRRTDPVASSLALGSAAPTSSTDSDPDPDPDSDPEDDTPASSLPSGSPTTTATIPPDPADEIEDPSFDIGDSVELDLDVATFAVDDAGIGGPPSAPNGDGEDSEDSTPELTGWAAFEASLRSELLRSGNTAFSVAVSIGGDVVHASAGGVRDPATGEPVDTDDRFRIASISKPITAIAAMTLVADGLVGLDDPIGIDVARHVGIDDPPASTRALTLRRLLTHTSGYGKYQSTFFRAGADSCEDAARQGLSAGAGGGGYTYSNMNYCVLGLAVEVFSGTTYERAVYERLLTPLGISGMRLPPTFDPGPDEVQHVTTPGRNYMETLGGAGSWIATPTDLVRIFDALDVEIPGFKPLDAETVLSMVTPAGGTFGQRGYGLGVISYGGGRVGHTGTIESTHAMVLDRGDGVTWALTVAGNFPSESTAIEGIVDRAFAAAGFVAG